jgi:signal transduction histidine kinase
MGLGLPMVKQIVESAGGKIWFESTLNIGTEFYIELPIVE